jgi:DNA-damage-inducible protein D
MSTEITPFENKAIRRVWHDEQWYFSVIDVISILTDSKDPNQYWKKLKSRDPEMIKGVQIVPLSLEAGKRKFICAHTEGVLRIVMSVPSPKAEPLKLWLAEQGKRTIDELNNPELLTERQAEYYKLKGYPEEWIAQRMKNIEIRKELTDEWQKRGVEKDKEYSILTATIAKNTFGLTPSEHAKLKGLEKENLRDHMSNLELLLTSLGEEVTRTIAVNSDAKGFAENHEAAQKGGEAGRIALKGVEKQTGQKVVSKDNFKHLKGSKTEEIDKTSELKD